MTICKRNVRCLLPAATLILTIYGSSVPVYSQGLDLTATTNLTTDAARQRTIQVLSSFEDLGTIEKVNVWSYDGQLRRTFRFSPALRASVAGYFPRIQSLFLVSSDGSAVFKASLLSIRTGAVKAVPIECEFAVADPDRNRIILVNKTRLDILDAADLSLVARRKFSRPIPYPTVGKDGSVSFLLSGFVKQCDDDDPQSCEFTKDRFVSLTQPGYAIGTRFDIDRSSLGTNLLAVDSKRGRILVERLSTSQPFDDARLDVETKEGTVNLVSTSFHVGLATPPAAGDRYLLVADLFAETGINLHVFDIETLAERRVLNNVSWTIRGRDSRGRLVTADGAELQIRDPKSLRLLDSLDLSSSVSFAQPYVAITSIDAKARVLSVLLRSGDVSDAQDALFFVKLDDLRLN